MKKFIIKTIILIFVSMIVYFGLIFFIGYSFYNSDLLRLKNKNILIAGDSHTEVSLNDSIISNSMNISQSADTYLYTFIRLRFFLNNDKKLKKVILGFSNHNIDKSINRWYTEDENISFKLPNQFYFMSYPEIKDLIRLNTKQLLKSYFEILFIKGKQLRSLFANKLVFQSLEIGYYRKLNGSNIEKDTLNNIKKIDMKIEEVSDIQLKYLLKIRDLCKENKVKLYLINTPQNRMNIVNDYGYLNRFKDKYLPNAKFIDEIDLKLNDSMFYDRDHLNSNGAIYFSKKIDSILKLNL